MNPGTTVRIARPTDRLREIARMYSEGIGLSVLAEFIDHDGFDGVVLGHSGQSYHIEFTTRHGHSVGRAPTDEHLLVFYVPERRDWEESCARMLSAGFHLVPSSNPYWDVRGKTFEDPDGYRVVLERSEWRA